MYMPARSLVFAAAKSLGVTPAQALEAYGVFFVKFVKDQVRWGWSRTGWGWWGLTCVAVPYSLLHEMGMSGSGMAACSAPP